MGKDALERVLKEDKDLLGDFGLLLLYAGSGVRAAVEDEIRGKKVNPWNVMEINDKTWTWLRPLLTELKVRRESDAKTLLAAK